MPVSRAGLAALLLPLAAVARAAEAQPIPDNPFGDDRAPAPVYGGQTYGGQTYGGQAYSGATVYGGATYGGAAYGGATYGGAMVYGRATYGGAMVYGGATYGGTTYGARTDDAPAVLAQTWTTVERIDDRARQVLLALPMIGPLTAHDYQPLFADEASGRWFLARQRRVKGAPPPWTIVSGDRTGMRGERAGDPSCAGRPICFEQPLGLTARGDALLTRSVSSRGTTLGSYAGARTPRRALAGRSVATRFALSPRQDRAAYATRGGVTLINWAGDGPSARPRPTRIAVDGVLDHLALTATTLFYLREVAPGEETVEAIDLASRTRRQVLDPGERMVPWAPLVASARGTVFTQVCRASGETNRCDLVELTPRGARIALRGIVFAYDISDDGRYVLVRRGPADRRGRTTAWDDLVVYDLVAGVETRVIREIEVTGAQFTR